MSVREDSSAVATRRAASSSGASTPRGKRQEPDPSVSIRTAGEPGQGRTSRKVSAWFSPAVPAWVFTVTAAS